MGGVTYCRTSIAALQAVAVEQARLAASHHGMRPTLLLGGDQVPRICLECGEAKRLLLARRTTFRACVNRSVVNVGLHFIRPNLRPCRCGVWGQSNQANEFVDKIYMLALHLTDLAEHGETPRQDNHRKVNIC